VRQRLLIALAAVGVVVALVVGIGAGGDEDGDYKVRAIFNNAAFAIPGEDVMIAGAKVGSIDALEVTDDLRAAVILKIDDPGFQDFREDAECRIRLQSVIGEKLVECLPTQPRPEGEPPPPPLPKIPEGQDGAGQRLLPVEQTLTPVGEDLIRNVMRRPYRERFAIILNEFGAGLAGRGKDLRKVIRGANPALRELDKVLRILADQNRLLADGARSGDRVLAEWAKQRESVSDAIVKANITAQATAEERANLERNFEQFPEFLRQLKPTMAALGEMSEQMTPVVRDLGAVGTDVSRILRALGPFSLAGIPAFQTLGDTSDVGSEVLPASLPTINLVGDLTSRARSLSSNLSKLLTSLRDEDGIQRLMDLIYYVALSTNGYDQFGHYLRTALLAGCNSLATVINPACTANFIAGASSARAFRRKPRTALDRILAGENPDKVMRQWRRQQARKAERQAARGEQPQPATAPAAAPSPQPAAAPQSGTSKPKLTPPRRKRDPVIDYLLGDGQ
jgi:phospholipid/cholesterol/gamma-HCH transport system substrate-binding protein